VPKRNQNSFRCLKIPKKLALHINPIGYREKRGECFWGAKSQCNETPCHCHPDHSKLWHNKLRKIPIWNFATRSLTSARRQIIMPVQWYFFNHLCLSNNPWMCIFWLPSISETALNFFSTILSDDFKMKRKTEILKPRQDSTRIRIFQNPQLFLSGFKNFPVPARRENIRIRCRIRLMRVNGSRIRKEKVADWKISGYCVWTGPWTSDAYNSHAIVVSVEPRTCTNSCPHQTNTVNFCISPSYIAKQVLSSRKWYFLLFSRYFVLWHCTVYVK